MNKEKVIAKIGEWLVDGDTGLSSKYLASVILHGKAKEVSYPYDPSDFNRCVKMCEFVGFPIEDAVFLASRQSVQWKAIHDHLPQVMRLYREECVGDSWRAPKLYAFMKEIREYADQNDPERIEKAKREFESNRITRRDARGILAQTA